MHLHHLFLHMRLLPYIQIFRSSSIALALFAILSSCDKDNVIPLIDIPVGDYPTDFSKEGGSFSVEIPYSKNVRMSTYGEEVEGTEFIRVNLVGDTLETNWYKAVISHEKVKNLSVQIYPNETKYPRDGHFYVVGTQENSAVRIAFSQSDR